MTNSPTSEVRVFNRAGTCAAALIVGVLAVAPFAGARFSRAGISALELPICLAVVLLAMQSRRTSVGRSPLAWVWLASLAGWSAVGTAVSAGRYASMVQLVDLIYWLAAFYAASAAVGSLPWARAAICGGAAAGGSLAAIFAVREYILARDPAWRAFGPFFNPGFLSGYLTLTLPITIALYLRAKRFPNELLALVCSLAQVSALFLSGTRYGIATGALALAVFLGIWARLGDLRGQWRKATGFIVLAAVAATISSAPLRTRVSAAGAEGHSLQFRLYTWRATVNMIRDHPVLGVGPGAFEQAFPRYNIAGFTRLAHQDYLQMAAETGLPGLAFFLMALIWALRAGAKAAFTEGDRDNALLAAGILAGALGSAARGMLDSDIYVFAIAITLWSCLGAAADRARPGKHCAKLASILTILAAPLALSFGSGNLLSQMADWALSRGNLAAGGYYRLAARLDPLNAFHQMRLGQFYTAASPDFPERAVRHFQRAIKLEPNRSRNYFILGSAYVRFGDYAAAIVEFRDALKYDPKSPRVILALAQTYGALGKREPAMAEYRKLLRQEKTPYETVRAIPQVVQPEYAVAHFAVAEDAEKHGQLREAAVHYRLCAERLEKRASFAKFIAALMTSGAITSEDEASLNDLYRQSCNRLSRAYSELGDSKLASKWAKKALKGLPTPG